jgi:hypothetical protein
MLATRVPKTLHRAMRLHCVKAEATIIALLVLVSRLSLSLIACDSAARSTGETFARRSPTHREPLSYEERDEDHDRDHGEAGHGGHVP